MKNRTPWRPTIATIVATIATAMLAAYLNDMIAAGARLLGIAGYVLFVFPLTVATLLMAAATVQRWRDRGTRRAPPGNDAA